MEMSLPAARMVSTLPTSVPESEDALVSLARRGDVEAFASLYRLHGGRVHALCLRLAGDEARAAELTQDVFVLAWEALPRFRGDAAFGSWLHRIAVNASLMATRSDRRRQARVALTEDLAAGGEVPTGSVAPRDVESAVDLERALRALPPGARAAFVLHEIEGFTHEEIARATGTAPGTVRAQLFRARKLLMEALDR
jgi:RNA polymerase sigma-70 factor (ECF subfamily)